MAISKTLTPTNETIQIPDFTDRPDQRVNSDCIEKEADAINALNTHIKTWTDISASCTWLNTITGKLCLYNATLKMLLVYIQVPSGTPNITRILTLPSGYTFLSTIFLETIGYSSSQRSQYKISDDGKGIDFYTSDNQASGIATQIYNIIPVV